MKIAYGETPKFYNCSKKLIANIDNIFNEYKAKGFKITVRQIYYQCVARNILKNKQSEYEKVSDLVKSARMAGLLDWDLVEDRTRYIRNISHWDTPQDIIEAAAQQYRIDTRATQPYYIEAWCEKDALVGILETTCNRLDIPCFSSRGFTSITALHEAALRFNEQNKECIILYAGDHDPSGLHIPKVIQDRLKTFNANVNLKRIGLTLSQIEELNLPPFYAKEKDSNFAEYVKNTGTTNAWELDALPPETLSAIFENEINKLTDFDKLKELQDKQNEDMRYFSKFINHE